MSGIDLQYVTSPGNGHKEKKTFMEVDESYQPPSFGAGYFQFNCTEETDGAFRSRGGKVTARVFSSIKGYPLTPYYVGRDSEQIICRFATQDAVEIMVSLQTKSQPNLRCKICVAEAAITRHRTHYLKGGHLKEELMPSTRISVRLPDEFVSIERLELLLAELGQKIPSSCIVFWGGIHMAFMKAVIPDQIFYARLKDGQKNPTGAPSPTLDPRSTPHQRYVSAQAHS